MSEPADSRQTPSHSASPAERERALEAAVLRLLLMEHPAQITLMELKRELGEPSIAIEDAVRALAGAGLVHRNGDFVVPSRAARSFDRLSID